MGSIVRGFISEIASVFEELNRASSSYIVNPCILFYSSITLAIIASFSSNTIALLIILCFTIALSLVLKVYKRIVKPLILVLVLGIITGLPLLVTGRSYIDTISVLGSINPSWAGIYSFTTIVLRLLAAATPMLVSIAYIGCYNIHRSLGVLGFLRKISFMIMLFLTILPRLLRILFMLLIAREARVMTKSKRFSWSVLTSSVGDLLLTSTHISQEIVFAFKARSFGEYPRYKTYLLQRDYLFVTIVSIVVTTCLLVELFGFIKIG